jgi:hypothetical protein
MLFSEGLYLLLSYAIFIWFKGWGSCAGFTAFTTSFETIF